MQREATRTRLPAVAGLFYPAEAEALEASIAGYLAGVEAPRDEPVPKALIAPHAGYVYSAAIAASAYARLRTVRDVIERVVLAGPAHRVYVRGVAAPSVDRFSTPLGDVPVDRAALERILALPQVLVSDAAHASEHSLEVHVPFLQLALRRFALVPLAVGEASGQEVADVLEALWGGPETLIVVSSDLSHYHDYATARRLDEATSHAIESLDPEALGSDSACGRIPIRGLLLAARRRGLRARTVDLRSSGDTAGSRNEVVGYGAYVFA